MIGWSDWWVLRPTYPSEAFPPGAPCPVTSPDSFLSYQIPISETSSGPRDEPKSVDLFTKHRGVLPVQQINFVTKCHQGFSADLTTTATLQLQRTYNVQLGDRGSVSLRTDQDVWPSPQSHTRDHGCVPFDLKVKGAKDEHGLQTMKTRTLLGTQQRPLTKLIWLVRKTVPDQFTLVGQK